MVDADAVFEKFSGRWPRKGDRLLSPSPEVSLAECADERNYRLLRGYKFAGDVLIQRAVEDYAERANLVFPALFNYRHYVELALKYLIQEYGNHAGVSLGNKNHNLTELWAKFIEIGESFGEDRTDEAMLAVESCIGELDAIDMKSTAFRYATDLKGNILPLPSEGLDLVALHDVMNGLESFFDAVDTHYSTTIDAEHENVSVDW